MKYFESRKVGKSKDNKEATQKNLLTNQIITQNSFKEHKEENSSIFSPLFSNQSLETQFFNEKRAKNLWVPRVFKVITMIYVVINIIILPSNNSERDDSDAFSTAASYSIAVLDIISIILHFCLTKSKNFYKILCLEFVIFSLSHFVFLNQIRLKTEIKPSDLSNLSNLQIDFLNTRIAFIFSFTDILLKLIFIFSSMNYFPFIFWVTFGNVLFILLFFLTSGQINHQYSLITLIIYFIGNIIINFISRKFTCNEKNYFLQNLLKFEYLKNAEEETNIFKSIKCGYFKISNNQIKEKNNFFEQEFDALKTYIQNKEKFNENNGESLFSNKKDSKLKRDKTTSYNKEHPNKNLTESTSTKIQVSYNHNSNSTFLTNDEIEEIIKNIILNIPDGEKFRTDLNLFLGNFLKPNITKNSGDDKKSVESVLKFKGHRPFASAANTLDLESSANNLIENNILPREREKENFGLPRYPTNQMPNFNNKISNCNNCNNQEMNVCLTLDNINNTNNIFKSQSSKMDRIDSKATIFNCLKSPRFNKDKELSPRKSNDLPKEKETYGNNVNNFNNFNSNAPLQNLNTSILNCTQTVINTNFNNAYTFSFFDYFTLNKSKFENFTNLGTSTLAYGPDKILSLEVLARVNEDNSIEFIFNDVSKIEFASGFKQFLCKTGQYLHDFKNPLICIQNEITELKEEIEVLMAMVIKHNDIIDNYNKYMINISGATGSAGSSLAKKIDFSLQECLLALDKFEYTRQMSEYCQSMIGSYEDFSMSIFSQQNIKISIKNFDLLNLLNFIDSMMQFQLTRSNKNLNFVLKLENFESDPEPCIKNNMISNYNEPNQNQNKYTQFLERKSSSEMFSNLQNLQKLNRKNTLASLNDCNKLQITEKDLEIFEKPEIIGSDESKLKRVLINILSNSQKFTISGSITLTVKKEISNGIKFYKFSITDTGVGMSTEDLDKLFTPFFSNNNNEMNQNGVGLGLINVKEITEHLGQGLKVSSELGKGTTMSFVIEDRYIDPNSNVNIFNEKKTLNNINEVSESMDSDRCLDHDLTLEVGRERFNIIHKKLPKIISIEEEENDVILYPKKEEMQVISSINNSKVNSNFDKIENSNKSNNLDAVSNSPGMNGYHINVDSPYLRTGYTFVKLSPKTVSRQSHKNILKFNRHTNLEALSGGISPINITRSESIKIGHSSNSKQNLSSLFKTRKTWAINSLISSSTKFFDKINTLMSNHNSHINNSNFFVTTFNKLTIQSDVNFQIKRSYERIEKETIITGINNSNNNFGTPTLMSSKKSSFQNFSQFKFKSNTEEEQNLISNSLSKFFENKKRMTQPAVVNRSSLGENQYASTIDEEGGNLEFYSKKLNVLLIDDEQSIRAFTKNSLKKISQSESIKFNIEEADDGISGLSKILYKFLRDQETFDLVIADDTMNFLDGSQLLKLLKILIDTEFFKRKLPENIVNKFVICSSDSENVKSKMSQDVLNIDYNNMVNSNKFNKSACYLQNNLEICDKPLNLDILKQFCQKSQI